MIFGMKLLELAIFFVACCRTSCGDFLLLTDDLTANDVRRVTEAEEIDGYFRPIKFHPAHTPASASSTMLARSRAKLLPPYWKKAEMARFVVRAVGEHITQA
jgi:hypothetical protein